MKPLTYNPLLALLAAFVGLGQPVASAQERPTTASEVDNEKEDIVILTPFVVKTEKDSGYRATNSISGTRLNTAIKDTPMPIEVITRDFIDDLGATDLREALKYSSGVMLETQNDLSSSGRSAYQGPGGVNNPEGATANPNGVQVKIRGFVTDNALRDGFVRLNSTDSVNIERIEVVRGPAALFYGTGNFGGVVNYLVKRPTGYRINRFDVSVGTNAFFRGQFDSAGPLTADKKLLYRVNGAVQSREDSTDYFEQDHTFVSPSLLWRPFARTEIDLNLESGSQNLSGIGARQVRSVANVGINNDQNEQGGLYTPPGEDPRSYRLTGPDTYRDSEAGNLEIKLTQGLFENVNLLVGYNRSTYDTDFRDIAAQLFTNVGPASLWQTIDLRPLSPGRGAASANVQDGLVPNSIVRYRWLDSTNDTTRDQFRAEVAAQFDLFENHRWLKIGSSILAGYSDLQNDQRTTSAVTIPNSFNYRAPNDLTPLRFGTQGDGSPDADMYENNRARNLARNEAIYASYQGTLLDDRLLVLFGLRRDTNETDSTITSINVPGANPSTTNSRGETQRDDTQQWGVSFKISEALSFYALESEGLQPNFSGRLLPDTGSPAGASRAKSREFGLKFDLFKGKVSGTISRYKVTKTGFVSAPWYSPVTYGNPVFDPTRDIIYNVSNWSPSQAPGGSNGGTTKLDTGAPWAAWQAGVATGAIFQSDQGTGSPTWYVNASRPEGAAYLDAGFVANDIANGGEWFGFLYQGEAGDSLVNNATQDTVAFHGSGSSSAALLLTDESEGWDGQLLFKPNDHLQIVINGAITEVQRVNFGQWMEYPYREDRWAVWNYNNGAWGTLNLPRDLVYGEPGDGFTPGSVGPDTFTRTGAGQAAGDDTPKYRFDFWVNYKFRETFQGLSVALGGYWESKRQYMSGVSRGAGQLIRDGDGDLLILYTEPRYNFDAMARYDWGVEGGRRQYVQVNVSNLLNDRDLYGLIYAAPIAAKLSYGIRF